MHESGAVIVHQADGASYMSHCPDWFTNPTSTAVSFFSPLNNVLPVVQTDRSLLIGIHVHSRRHCIPQDLHEETAEALPF